MIGLSNHYYYSLCLELFGAINYSIKGSEPLPFYDARLIFSNLRSLLALQITVVVVY